MIFRLSADNVRYKLKTVEPLNPKNLEDVLKILAVFEINPEEFTILSYDNHIINITYRKNNVLKLKK